MITPTEFGPTWRLDELYFQWICLLHGHKRIFSILLDRLFSDWYNTLQQPGETEKELAKQKQGRLIAFQQWARENGSEQSGFFLEIATEFRFQ